MNQVLMVIVAAFLVAGCASSPARDNCSYDRKALLSLDEQAFDQDLTSGGGGWRKLSRTPGCELAAADLLSAYRAAHPAASSLLAWHEGQVRASANQYSMAIPLLASHRKDPSNDWAGWNHYVDATVAFLKGDKGALLRARDRLADVLYPNDADMPPFKDGHMEIPVQEGQPPIRVRWPPNIDVVDGLVKCFGKPYSEAYGACRPESP